MKKVAIYCRVSTEEQAQVQEGSIKNQRESLKRYLDAENLKGENQWGKLIQIYVDEGFSAKNLQRPGVHQLLLDVHRRHIDTILITEISRLSRSVEDWIHLRRFFEEHKTSFIATRQSFDTSNAMGRAMLSFAIEFSQLERELTAERVKASHQARSSRGLWTGGFIPFGLEKSSAKGHLKVNSAKKILAQRILEIFLESGQGLAGALRKLEEEGFHRDDGKAWTFASLQSWIRNPAIVGEIHLNRENKDKNQKTLSEAERFRIVAAQWGPLVDRKLWEKACRLLEERHKNLKLPSWKHHHFILSGLLYCPKGCKLTGASGTGRSGRKYTHYRHGTRALCDYSTKNFPTEEVENIVLESLQKLLQQPKNLESLVQEANKTFLKSQNQEPILGKDLQRKIRNLEEKIDLSTEHILRAGKQGLKGTSWYRKMDAMEMELEVLKKKEKAFLARSKSASPSMLSSSKIKEALKQLLENFHKLQPSTKRGLLSAILEKIQILERETQIIIDGPRQGDQDPKKYVEKSEGFYSGKAWLLRTDLNRRPGG